MTLSRKELAVKRSGIPAAGKGLFTKVDIAKGTRIVEYTGPVTSWKDADHKGGKNLYLFYVNKDHVIDASNSSSLARYANDALGISRIKGIRNNSEYVTEKKRVYIKSRRDIPAGSEILVGYGKEYWDVIKDILL